MTHGRIPTTVWRETSAGRNWGNQTAFVIHRERSGSYFKNRPLPGCRVSPSVASVCLANRNPCGRARDRAHDPLRQSWYFALLAAAFKPWKPLTIRTPIMV